MSQQCNQPISWLVLEQFVLGELSHQKTDATRGHLASCGACQRALQSIETDTVVLPGWVVPPVRKRTAKSRTWLAWSVGAALATAIVLLIVWPRSQPGGASIALKGGGELVVKVIRARGEVIDIDASSFREGDRVKLAVTCTVPGEVVLDVSVMQADERHHPLGDKVTAWCGNDVILPGAFEVSGSEPIEVCVTPAGETQSACITLTAETP